MCASICVCVCERERVDIYASLYEYITTDKHLNSRLTARTWLGSAALAVAVALPV